MIQLSIVVPTFNELGNVQILRDRVAAALPDIEWEMIFVDDDSPDGTAALLRRLAQDDPRVRCIQRIGRRGLSSACIEGMLSSSAPFVAVMDADLQHDEKILGQMFGLLECGELDIVVGSRYSDGGGTGDWDPSRVAASRFATGLSGMVLKADLKDPMSGFFMMRRDAFMACAHAGLSGVGFKILLDLFATSPKPLRYREVPYQFGLRVAGESKLDSNVAWEFVIMLIDRYLHGVIPARFIAFSLVGGMGLVVHLLVLSMLYKGMGSSFILAQSVATMVAMTCNYLLNNLLTYRDMRLRGWRLLSGWLSFTLVCSIGALANVGIAAYLYQSGGYWIGSAISGVLVAAVWNYAVTAVYTWRSPKGA